MSNEFDLALTALCDEFRVWTADNNLSEEGDALDLLYCDITPEQRDWLTNFSERWDIAQARTDAHAELSPLGFARKCLGGNCYGWSKTNAAGHEIVICTDESATEDPEGRSAVWGFSVFSNGDEIESGEGLTLRAIISQLSAAGKF